MSLPRDRHPVGVPLRSGGNPIEHKWRKCVYMGRFVIFLGAMAGFAFGEQRLATISVEELENPISGKALRMLQDAQRHLRTEGQHDRGMQELRRAMQDPQAVPYAIGMLGAEHLKSGDTDLALPELEEAARLLPAHPETHANFALALCRKHQTERGLQEAKRALQLDPSRAKTRY